MKDISTWPDPPQFIDKTPPSIPEEYTVFGLTYKVQDNQPLLISNSKTKIDIKKIEAGVNKSYDLFKNIIKDIIDEKDITIKIQELNNFHKHMNNYLNNCREDEGLKIIEKEINEHHKKLKECKEKLDQEMK